MNYKRALISLQLASSQTLKCVRWGGKMRHIARWNDANWNAGCNILKVRLLWVRSAENRKQTLTHY